MKQNSLLGMISQEFQFQGFHDLSQSEFHKTTHGSWIMMGLMGIPVSADSQTQTSASRIGSRSFPSCPPKPWLARNSARCLMKHRRLNAWPQLCRWRKWSLWRCGPSASWTFWAEVSPRSPRAGFWTF